METACGVPLVSPCTLLAGKCCISNEAYRGTQSVCAGKRRRGTRCWRSPSGHSTQSGSGRSWQLERGGLLEAKALENSLQRMRKGCSVSRVTIYGSSTETLHRQTVSMEGPLPLMSGNATRRRHAGLELQLTWESLTPRAMQ